MDGTRPWHRAWDWWALDGDLCEAPHGDRWEAGARTTAGSGVAFRFPLTIREARRLPLSFYTLLRRIANTQIMGSFRGASLLNTLMGEPKTNKTNPRHPSLAGADSQPHPAKELHARSRTRKQFVVGQLQWQGLWLNSVQRAGVLESSEAILLRPEQTVGKGSKKRTSPLSYPHPL